MKDRDAFVAKEPHKILEESGVPLEKAPDSYKNAEIFFSKKYGGAWKFNQVIGWLLLYANPSYVGGHLWWVQAKRIGRTMRDKIFYLTTPSNALVSYVKPNDNSQTIYRKTIAAIEVLAKEKPLKGRYIDLEHFNNIGPYINWRELLNSSG